jgi:hypothetical protein
MPGPRTRSRSRGRSPSPSADETGRSRSASASAPRGRSPTRAVGSPGGSAAGGASAGDERSRSGSADRAAAGGSVGSGTSTSSAELRLLLAQANDALRAAEVGKAAAEAEAAAVLAAAGAAESKSDERLSRLEELMARALASGGGGMGGAEVLSVATAPSDGDFTDDRDRLPSAAEVAAAEAAEVAAAEAAARRLRQRVAVATLEAQLAQARRAMEVDGVDDRSEYGEPPPSEGMSAAAALPAGAPTLGARQSGAAAPLALRALQRVEGMLQGASARQPPTAADLYTLVRSSESRGGQGLVLGAETCERLLCAPLAGFSFGPFQLYGATAMSLLDVADAVEAASEALGLVLGADTDLPRALQHTAGLLRGTGAELREGSIGWCQRTLPSLMGRFVRRMERYERDCVRSAGYVPSPQRDLVATLLDNVAADTALEVVRAQAAGRLATAPAFRPSLSLSPSPAPAPAPALAGPGRAPGGMPSFQQWKAAGLTRWCWVHFTCPNDHAAKRADCPGGAMHVGPLPRKKVADACSPIPPALEAQCGAPEGL